MLSHPSPSYSAPPLHPVWTLGQNSAFSLSDSKRTTASGGGQEGGTLNSTLSCRRLCFWSSCRKAPLLTRCLARRRRSSGRGYLGLDDMGRQRSTFGEARSKMEVLYQSTIPHRRHLEALGLPVDPEPQVEVSTSPTELEFPPLQTRTRSTRLGTNNGLAPNERACSVYTIMSGASSQRPAANIQGLGRGEAHGSHSQTHPSRTYIPSPVQRSTTKITRSISLMSSIPFSWKSHLKLWTPPPSETGIWMSNGAQTKPP